MPTYDYECDSCGHRFEKFQSIKARAVKKCPACEKRTVRRLIGTGGAIIFKGSGFYTTDYRSDEYKKAASADKPPESASDKKDKKDKKDQKSSSGDGKGD